MQVSVSEAGFELDSRLAADTFALTDLTLSRVLLMNDCRYPWLILVPRRCGVREIHHLQAREQSLLWLEIAGVSELLEAEFSPHKMNVGALGNIVAQLHIHVIARREEDPAWPGPVWGHSAREAYSIEEAKKRTADLTAKLNYSGIFGSAS